MADMTVLNLMRAQFKGAAVALLQLDYDREDLVEMVDEAIVLALPPIDSTCEEIPS